VSASLIRGDYFEDSVVDGFVRLLRRYPDVGFVDLGANIGTFILPASRITNVVAVEPYSKTMARLFKSVLLGRVGKNVRLVFNAIFNQRWTSAIVSYYGNVGGTYLKAAKMTDCRGGSYAHTIPTPGVPCVTSPRPLAAGRWVFPGVGFCTLVSVGFLSFLLFFAHTHTHTHTHTQLTDSTARPKKRSTKCHFEAVSSNFSIHLLRQ